jgi:hypothetical protein
VRRCAKNCVMRTRAVIIAIGINWDGRRSVLAVELAQRERYFGRTAYSAPCRAEFGVLTKAGLAAKYQRPALRPRFFLVAGYVYRCQRSRSAASALAKTRLGR